MLGKSHGWRSLIGYSPWGRKELDTTEQLNSNEGNDRKLLPKKSRNLMVWERRSLWKEDEGIVDSQSCSHGTPQRAFPWDEQKGAICYLRLC